MKNELTGWVVANTFDGDPIRIYEWSFAGLRKESIAKVIEGSRHDWNHWKRQGMRCVKAKQTTEIL